MIPRIGDARLVEVFTREILTFLVGRELLSPEWAGRILSWRHTGFSVHSRMRTKTKPEAERVGKYVTRRCFRSRKAISLKLPGGEGPVGMRLDLPGEQRRRAG